MIVLQKLFSIAANTFREAIRNRVLHAVLLMSFALVISSLAIGALSVENNARVIRDMGVTFINFTVIFVAIFSGVSLLQVELQRKTIYTIVTKPVARWLFIVGKFLGLAATLFVVQLLVSLVFALVIIARGDPFSVVIVQSLVLMFFEGALIAAVATVFSSFSTPVLSGVLTFGVFILGRLRGALYKYAELMKEEALATLIKGMGVVIPDLTLYRADIEVAYTIPLNWSFVAYTCTYSLAYTGVCLILAILIFSRRDFV